MYENFWQTFFFGPLLLGEGNVCIIAEWPIKPELISASVKWSHYRSKSTLVLSTNTTQCPRPGLGPEPLDTEMSALTMRPSHLPGPLLGRRLINLTMAERGGAGGGRCQDYVSRKINGAFHNSREVKSGFHVLRKKKKKWHFCITPRDSALLFRFLYHSPTSYSGLSKKKFEQEHDGGWLSCHGVAILLITVENNRRNNQNPVHDELNTFLSFHGELFWKNTIHGL